MDPTSSSIGSWILERVLNQALDTALDAVFRPNPDAGERSVHTSQSITYNHNNQQNDLRSYDARGRLRTLPGSRFDATG